MQNNNDNDIFFRINCCIYDRMMKPNYERKAEREKRKKEKEKEKGRKGVDSHRSQKFRCQDMKQVSEEKEHTFRYRKFQSCSCNSKAKVLEEFEGLGYDWYVGTRNMGKKLIDVEDNMFMGVFIYVVMFNTEKLTYKVELCPHICAISPKEYSNREVKVKCWTEIQKFFLTCCFNNKIPVPT